VEGPLHKSAGSVFTLQVRKRGKVGKGEESAKGKMQNREKSESLKKLILISNLCASRDFDFVN
jgi:hypothetical protein